MLLGKKLNSFLFIHMGILKLTFFRFIYKKGWMVGENCLGICT